MVIQLIKVLFSSTIMPVRSIESRMVSVSPDCVRYNVVQIFGIPIVYCVSRSLHLHILQRSHDLTSESTFSSELSMPAISGKEDDGIQWLRPSDKLRSFCSSLLHELLAVLRWKRLYRMSDTSDRITRTDTYYIGEKKMVLT